MKQTQSGFTLIELMVTVAIIGILAAIAIPSYQSSVMKSRRADAEGALLGLANAMERHYTENPSRGYCDAAATGGTKVDPCGDGTIKDTGSPSIYVAQSPASGTAAYNLTIDSATKTTYTLKATRTGAQTSDTCGDLTLTSAGVKGVVSGSRSVDECWSQR